ncbi:FecR family protein [Hyunsoonleella aquatilis]|nr:FecR family protein [Hyunsoonleella aquatilis]
MEQQMNAEELEKKWLNNTLSEDEKRQFNDLEDAEYKQFIVDASTRFKSSNFSRPTGFERFNKAYKTRGKSPENAISWKSVLRVAAMVILSLGIYYSIVFNPATTIETDIGEKRTVSLPDNSIVTLNAVSEIEFKADDWEEKRTLQLDGEAYFKVNKGSTFQVTTDEGTVKVLGTEFSVKARPGFFQVACFEGKVEVVHNYKNHVLIGGQTFKLSKNKYEEGHTSQKIPAWTKNMSIFDATPIHEVLAELKRQYQVEITHDIDATRLFSGAFVHDNLENALISIVEPMNLTYEFKASNLIEIHEKKD